MSDRAGIVLEEAHLSAEDDDKAAEILGVLERRAAGTISDEEFETYVAKTVDEGFASASRQTKSKAKKEGKLCEVCEDGVGRHVVEELRLCLGCKRALGL